MATKNATKGRGSASSSTKGSGSSSSKKSNTGRAASTAKKSSGTQAKRGASTSSSSTAKKSFSSKSSARQKQPESLMMKLMVDSLKDIYWAEKNQHKALKTMIKEATSQQLKEAFTDHQSITEVHIQRVEEAFGMLGLKPQAKKCEAMVGLIKEVKEMIEETKDDTNTRDAALILGAQKAEHYEIATYGTLATIANSMGLEDLGNLLGEILEEEKQTDELLTSIAEECINAEAIEESE